MMRKRIIIIIIITILVALSYTYQVHTLNKITNRYDWNTLLNIRSMLDTIVYEYEEQYKNRPVSEEEIRNNDIFRIYLRQMYKISVYIDVSPNFRDTTLDLKLDRISQFEDDGISIEEIEYLINVRDKYEIALNKINDQLYEDIIRKIFGVFTRSNVEELDAVFEGIPRQ